MKTYPIILGITLITLSIAALITACTGERVKLRPKLNKPFEYQGTTYKWRIHNDGDCYCDEVISNTYSIKATVDCSAFSKSPCE